MSKCNWNVLLLIILEIGFKSVQHLDGNLTTERKRKALIELDLTFLTLFWPAKLQYLAIQNNKLSYSFSVLYTVTYLKKSDRERQTKRNRQTKWTAGGQNKLEMGHWIKGSFKLQPKISGTGQQDRQRQTEISVRWLFWKQCWSEWMTGREKDMRAGYFVTWLTGYCELQPVWHRKTDSEAATGRERKTGWWIFSA